MSSFLPNKLYVATNVCSNRFSKNAGRFIRHLFFDDSKTVERFIFDEFTKIFENSVVIAGINNQMNRCNICSIYILYLYQIKNLFATKEIFCLWGLWSNFLWKRFLDDFFAYSPISVSEFKHHTSFDIFFLNFRMAKYPQTFPNPNSLRIYNPKNGRLSQNRFILGFHFPKETHSLLKDLKKSMTYS